MAKKTNINRIVVSTPASTPEVLEQQVSTLTPIALRQRRAPAWFYSALGWLGKTYFDANHATQGFASYLAGSDVDPYAQLGSTRLFWIRLADESFELTIAPDPNTPAPLQGGTRHRQSDEGILEMYLALAASPVFASARFCYVPGRIGSDLDPNPLVGPTRNGYDPSTGLRALVLGSAVAQVVPLDNFLAAHNEQIYDPAPVIVPLASAFVYDITQHNTLGATTFTLPAYYGRDRIAAGSDAVNKLSGATVVFTGGPGFAAATATTLTQTAATTATVNSHTFTTTTFATATTVTTAPVGVQAMIGIGAFTVKAPALAVFAEQKILGFYRDAAWATTLGTPIWDFGGANSQLAATTGSLTAPLEIYDPSHAFLNGGSLANVVRSLDKAQYLISWDRLAIALESARTNRAGFTVTGAELSFAASTAPGPIVDQLDVPIVATVTTTPAPIAVIANPIAGDVAVRNRTFTNLPGGLVQIGSGANAPAAPSGPSTIQVGLTASIPREALDGTGIVGVELGTAFAPQSLGSVASFQSAIINLTTSHVAPYALTLAGLGVTFAAGVTYVITLASGSVTVRGSDGSTASAAAPAGANAAYTYVGSAIYTAATTTVALYPKLQLSFAAPAVGTNGVEQGTTYCVRVTYGANASIYDLTDTGLTPVAAQISVPNPPATDGSQPSAGDLYFGSFIGGAATMTVWSVPFFVEVKRADLAKASANGALTLTSEVSGVPAYQLQVTDSSLFVFTDLDVDSKEINASSVFLAAAVINSAPDDTSPQAFAPSRLVLGIVRAVRIAGALKFVFVPADDSIVIGAKRYITSVIELDALDFDPNTRPYPPPAWPAVHYWQFANKHDPYLGVRYTGETQAAREATAQADIKTIAKALKRAGEPMQLVLDTDREVMKISPIYAFPIDAASESIDHAKLESLAATIAGLISNLPSQTASATATRVDESIALPQTLSLANPFAAGIPLTQASSAVAQNDAVRISPDSTIAGIEVTNLSPNTLKSSVAGLDRIASANAIEAQVAAANVAVEKLRMPALAVTQERVENFTVATGAMTIRRQAIYGFSVVRPSTGEAYLVELVDADQTIPDQLPNPTQNVTYDPYYVRVVVLATMTSYNMSIIVPAIVHDQFGFLALEGTEYGNVLAKTDDFSLGYDYAIADATGANDTLTFSPYPTSEQRQTLAKLPVVTNNPYLLAQATETIAVIVPPPVFACRRRNWNAECLLMRSTHRPSSALYLAFGDGDLVPMRLDGPVVLDKRAPAHLHAFTYTFSDREYADAKIVSVSNTPYVVATSNYGSGSPSYISASINATAGTAGVDLVNPQPLQFPTEIYVAGQASTTLTRVATLTASYGWIESSGDLFTQSADNKTLDPQYQLVPYNGLVYLIRAVSNAAPLASVGNLGITSGLLIDTFVAATTGNLVLAAGARHKRSGQQFFGASYTPSTLVDSLDDLDYTSITGNAFLAPTIFVPIPELDATKGFIANLSNFIGQQFWTFIYPEIVAQPKDVTNGVTWTDGLNLDAEGKPVLSMQKLHFVYDSIAVLYTPNDLTHKYALPAKQQILALTNGQIQEGICWRSANLQPQRDPPTNICAQQLLPDGPEMDRPNIIYSANNRPVATSTSPSYLGTSVEKFVAVSGCVYNIEESAFANDQTASTFVSQVSSISNLVVGVVFDYDNNDQGDLGQPHAKRRTKGLVFLNGYLSAAGYTFSSPDHFDVNDVVPSQIPLLEQDANTLGFDVAFFNADISLPRDWWTLTYDGITAPGLPGFITNVPPAIADPTFSNRTRSLVLSLQNPVQPNQLGLIDTYGSVVSANLHLENGVTGSVFLSKKADRDVASIANIIPIGDSALYGVPTKYDFFIFSRDHYQTLLGAHFELIDQGYAMCLVDDGTGTGTKVARYFIDNDGNYYELYNYVLYSPDGGVLETSAFTVRVTLGAPANPVAVPAVGETPNNVNPQDLVAQINKVSNLVYAAFGASSSGQPPAYIPIQAVGFPPGQSGGSGVQALPIIGAPGFNGYALNVAAANRQPFQIAQIYSGTTAYAISGPTTIVPVSAKSGKAVPFYGSISHGLDRMLPLSAPLVSSDGTQSLPRPTVPATTATGTLGGNGLGSLIGTQFSWAFQGSAAIPPATASNPTPGTTMKADDSVFYTWNAIGASIVDSGGKSGSGGGSQYFIDTTDPLNPIYGVIALPKFSFNGNSYAVNLATSPHPTLVVGGKSYPFEDSANVTADLSKFTFNAQSGGVWTVTYQAGDPPTGQLAPTPIALTPFSITIGGTVTNVDVFNQANLLATLALGIPGRIYAYDPVHGTVTITQGSSSTTVPIQTGITFASNSGYGYEIGFANGAYTINGAPMFKYSATLFAAPPSHPIMTAPHMFTLGGNFYTFDQDATGAYLSVTGRQQTIPINPYQFSLDGIVYIINTSVQPNTVVGGGNIYPMTTNNTQFVIAGDQYTITLKSGSLNGATIAGQFNVTQGNVVVIEDYVYEVDTLDGQIVGNGSTYPLTTSGLTYTISTADRSFTVTTEPNATTVALDGIVYQINNTSVVGDGVVYPILPYRTFSDGAATYHIGNDGVVALPTPLALSSTTPPTFTDGATYTVNDTGAFDGTTYYRVAGTPPQFTAGALTYTLRNDGVSVAAGPTKTYLGATSGALVPYQFTFGTTTIFFKPTDLAAFDGKNYYAIVNNSFTDTAKHETFTISGNTAVNAGNSYEIFSNLGQGGYFQVPGGSLYFVNVAVANPGIATGDIYSVFPISGGQFTIPLQYTITVSGSTASVAATTFTGAVSTLQVSGGVVTGGYFIDPVTQITYTCIVDSPTLTTFVDSNNTVYPFTSGVFTAAVVVATAVNIAVDSQSTPAIYPVVTNQFVTPTATYQVGVPIAYANPSGPFLPMVNNRFIIANTAPISSFAYTVTGNSVTKGYVVSVDDQFSADGNVVYTVDAVNVVKATNQVLLSGSVPMQTLTAGALSYTLDSTNSVASIKPAGLAYDAAAHQFTATVNGVSVTYTVGATSVVDSRNPQSLPFPATMSGTTLSFTDSVTAVTFSFDSSGNNPITVSFPYTNSFFNDALTGVTYYVDAADTRVEAISYLPATTGYAFTAGNKKTYLIHYNDVRVVFPVISGANVNAGIATVGANMFTVDVDEVVPIDGSAAIAIDRNSFEINGNLYTIAGVPNGSDYTKCTIIGNAAGPWSFTNQSQFQLTDKSITYTLQLDSANLPVAVSATFPILPSRDLLVVDDAVYVITYNTVSTGSLLGQGFASIAITSSAFTLKNRLDATTAKFTFADLDIYDAASVVGQFGVYLAPTFSIGAAIYTLDTVRLVVTDADKRPIPLLPNPMMFSINGANYVLDTNQIPHAVIGNNNVSPLSTDVTVESGQPVANSTFTLNGLVYELVEDAQHELLAVTGTKMYPIAQPTLTFKLDTSLVFTLSTAVPAPGNYVGSIAPIAWITAGSGSTLVNLDVFPGRPESGGAPFFNYKSVLYTLMQSSGTYVAVQKTYTVYSAAPVGGQLQLAVFDLAGTTYLVSDGTSPGAATPAGIHPGTMWAATAYSNVETQYGVVYGFAAQPTTVSQSGSGTFQFQITDATGTTTLYDIIYTAGGTANIVKVDVPSLLPTFMQDFTFTFTKSYPLTFETGGYNAYTVFDQPTALPVESYAGSYKTPITSSDPRVDQLLTTQGDFSVELWHSIPSVTQPAYHPFTWSSSTTGAFVNLIDIDFENDKDIYVQINNTVLMATATPPVLSSGWRHIALTFEQPYTMMYDGMGAFEVKAAGNYNFDRELSIAMTFSCLSDTFSYGMLYKGTGSDSTPPELDMSYRVQLDNGEVTFQIKDGNGNTSKVFKGPKVKPELFYQLIIVKATTTAVTLDPTDPGPNPYALPYDVTDFSKLQKSGISANASGLGSDGPIKIANLAPADSGGTTKLGDFLTALQTPTTTESYYVTISVRTVHDNGTFGPWHSVTGSADVSGDTGLSVNSTGDAHLLIGETFDDQGKAASFAGNIRDVYLFNQAINRTGIQVSSTGVIDIADATTAQLQQAGLVGAWIAAYDPNGVVNNAIDPGAPAVSTTGQYATLSPLAGHERDGAMLYVNGIAVKKLSLVTKNVPDSLGQATGSSLQLDAGAYRLAEITIWQAVRQAYQVVDDMFGRLTTDPTLAFYLSGTYPAPSSQAYPQPPLLPMNAFIDNRATANEGGAPITLSNASLDLTGPPTVGACGPLITPNLYTPPGVALTVCDTPPSLTTYSVTLNNLGGLAGELNEAYVYVKDKVLTLYAGKKIGDLVMSWVSQEQGDVQIIGYVEGPPPAPMANLTNKSSYAGATSLTLTVPTSMSLKLQRTTDDSDDSKHELDGNFGNRFGLGTHIAPFGMGIDFKKGDLISLSLNAIGQHTWGDTTDNSDVTTANLKYDESDKYTVKLQGAMAPYTNDQFMASLNSLSVPSSTIGTSASKAAILPNPNLGGFTTSNPPAALPKAPTEEKFGARMFVPSPYGQAFVMSATLDVYQQTLVQTNTVYGFVRIPNTQIPRDLNIVSFRMNSQYIRPGLLDGVIGYAYNPATLPSGARTYATSTGDMQVLYDKNFSPGAVGNNASYMRVVEAYQLKRQIDQEATNALALYQTAYQTSELPSDSKFTPGLDFYNEYVWTARGGTQEEKHTYTTSYDEVLSVSSTNNKSSTGAFEAKISAAANTILDAKYLYVETWKSTIKNSFNTTGTTSFDIAASFDGIESDTQMRYASNNDAHFVMKFNSMFNSSNQSGLNLVIGSDGLVYNVASSPQSGAGLPTSNNLDDSLTYSQPPPAYVSGNADGPTGNLEPYDRPGKVKQFRTYAFFLQPSGQNAADFWNTIVDPIWLANSPDADAAALRDAQQNGSAPWRVLYRVTYCERFLPPISTETPVVPQITPVIAVPVLDAAADFLFTPISTTTRPAHNPDNDLAANVVLAAPTTSGVSAGTLATVGPNIGLPIPPNNVIPFDLVKGTTTIVNWADTTNAKLLANLLTSVLGLAVVPMSAFEPGSTKLADVIDPVSGGPLYSIYTDPNGATINVAARSGVSVYQDVNGNPIQYYDGKTYHSLQEDYVASADGTVMYYLLPPSTYDQSAYDLTGDYDLFGHPGDQWRYFLVSGASANMMAQPTVANLVPFTSTAAYTGFHVASSQHDDTSNQVKGYVLVQGVVQWPQLNSNAETFADVLVYKAMSVLDTFPIGDPNVLIQFLKAQYGTTGAFSNNEICTVFARNIMSYFNTVQQALLPQ